MEFHSVNQDKQSVEQLGIELQKLAHKAFPTLSGDEFDRLLKGRFYSALLPKWQKKLGAPKPSERFSDLYERARTIEKHEEQFRKSETSRSESGQRFRRRQQAPPSTSTSTGTTPETQPKVVDSSGTGGPRPRGGCFVCYKVGHKARNCPERKTYVEAPGKNQPQKNNVSAVQTGSAPKLSVHQLERMLAESRLQEERDNLEASLSTVNAVTVASGDPGVAAAVGPAVYLPVVVGGVGVDALVDTGSPAVFISCEMLQRIALSQKRLGVPVLSLESPQPYRFMGREERNWLSQLRPH